jgi:hypothetical protein
MADRRVGLRSAEAAVYVSMVGRRANARNAEAVVFVNIAGRRANARRCGDSVVFVSMWEKRILQGVWRQDLCEHGRQKYGV